MNQREMENDALQSPNKSNTTKVSASSTSPLYILPFLLVY